MENETFSGLTLQRCSGCKGLWFKPEAFERLKKDDWLSDHIDTGSASEGAKQDKIRRIQCPECGSGMRHIADDKQAHILYEECPDGCGVYFDAGEFRDLAKTTFWDKFKTKKLLGKK